MTALRRRQTAADRVSAWAWAWALLLVMLAFGMACTAARGQQSGPEAGVVYYRVEGIAESAEPELKGIRLLAPWLSYSPQTRQLRARIVFRNVSRSPRSVFGLMANDDYRLSTGDGVHLTPRSLTPGLNSVVPVDGLAPNQSNAGVLTYDLPGSVGTVDSVALKVTRFNAIEGKLAGDRRFVPPPPGVLLPVNQVLRSGIDAMSLVALEVDAAMVTTDGKLVVSLGVRNMGRADLHVTTKLAGKDARLVDGELNLRAPDAVSPAFENDIVPVSGVLVAGTPHNGTVRFPLADAIAANQWQFFYPGYQRMAAKWNARTGRFEVEVADLPAPGATGPANSTGGGEGAALAAGERRYRGIDALIKRLQERAAAGDERAYLAAMPAHLRESHGRLLRDRDRVGVRGFAFELPPLQKFDAGADGVVRNVQVLVRYRIADGPPRNRMVAYALASFAPTKGSVADNEWRVVDFRFVKAAPFWLLGHVAKKQTEHFSIFYREGSESADRIGKAGRQLEKSYRGLKRKGLPVEDRNLAIFLARADDFAAVAGVDADQFDGAAMLHYEINDGRYEVGNRMVYINDANFVTGQRLWGMQDRQTTITHELVHLFLSRDSRPWTPAWVAEGIAVHFAGQYNSWSRRALRKNPRFETTTLSALSMRHTLARGSDDANATQAAYLLSGEAFSRLEKMGKGKPRALLAFYRGFAAYDPASIRSALAARGVAPDPGQAPDIASVGPVVTNILLKQHFDTDLKTLDKDAKAVVRKRGF